MSRGRHSFMVKSCGWWVVANEIILLSLALFAFPFLTPISHSHFPFSFPILIPILIPISRSDFPFPSSEEMMAAMTEVNELQDTKNLVILSTDISAMFTSMDIAECAKIAADMFFESGMELNIDTEELGLYLAVTVNRARLTELGVGDFCHVRIKSRGAHPGITTKEILDRDNKTESLFFKPIRKPNKNEARLMFRIAFEILIKVAMSEHMYSFNGDLRKQKAGGAIGNVLTCALAVLFTVWWCKKFLDKVNEACRELSDFMVYLLKIYIDDQNLACEALPPVSCQERYSLSNFNFYIAKTPS